MVIGTDMYEIEIAEIRSSERANSITRWFIDRSRSRCSRREARPLQSTLHRGFVTVAGHAREHNVLQD